MTMSSRAPLFVLPVLILILVPGFSAAADQRLSDLLLLIQRLEREVQQLHGQLEVQQNELSILRRRQREQYLDLDARLQGAVVQPAPDHGAGNAIGSGALPAANTTHIDLAAAGAPSATPIGEQEAYHHVFDLLKQRRYEDAVRGFEDLLARYPNGEFADNARYWLGETHYVRHDYAAALIQFWRVAVDYPLSPKVPAALLKISYIHYEKGDWQRARNKLQDIIEKFPDTAEAQRAQDRLERMTRERALNPASGST